MKIVTNNDHLVLGVLPKCELLTNEPTASYSFNIQNDL